MESTPPVWLQFLPLILLSAIVVYPVSRILRRAGFSPWYSLLIFVPFAAFVGLWVLAFIRWPLDDLGLRKVFSEEPGVDVEVSDPPFLKDR